MAWRVIRKERRREGEKERRREGEKERRSGSLAHCE